MNDDICASIEDMDEYRKIKNDVTHTAMKYVPKIGFTPSKTPSDVETPFPPLNLSHIGNICPITAHAPIKKDISFGKKFLQKKGIANPFSKSSANTIAPTFLPSTRTAFVAPIFPDPNFRISLPET